MRDASQGPSQHFVCKHRWTVIIGIEQDENPTVMTTLSRGQRKVAIEFVGPIEKSVPSYPNRWWYVSKLLGSTPSGQPSKKDWESRYIAFAFHDRGDFHRTRSPKSSACRLGCSSK